MLEKLVEIIIELLHEDDEVEVPENADKNTRLLGDKRILDSLSLVTLLVGLEQRIEEEFDVRITFMDNDALVGAFGSVGRLAKYAEDACNRNK